jgi:hypothetical protein
VPPGAAGRERDRACPRQPDRHGVEIIHGAARFEDPHTLRLDTPDGARRARRSSCWRPDPRPTGRTASRSTIRKLVGAHIVGERATELIHIASTGLALGATLETFIDAVYNFPTLSQLYKYAAYDALGKLPGGSSILRREDRHESDACSAGALAGARHRRRRRPTQVVQQAPAPARRRRRRPSPSGRGEEAEAGAVDTTFPPAVLTGDGDLVCDISAKENGHQKLTIVTGGGLEFDVAVSPIVDGTVTTEGPDKGGSYRFTSHLAKPARGKLPGVGEFDLDELETKVMVEMKRYKQPAGKGTASPSRRRTWAGGASTSSSRAAATRRTARSIPSA